MLDLVHSCVCRPMEVASLGGPGYFLTSIYEHSSLMPVYVIKQKFEAVHHSKEFQKYDERQTGRSIRVLRSDGVLNTS